MRNLLSTVLSTCSSRAHSARLPTATSRTILATCSVILAAVLLIDPAIAAPTGDAPTTDARAVDAPSVEDGTLLIGLVVPSSGPERERGEAMRNGATLAVEQINVSGGIYGARLALRIEESGADGQSQLKAFSNLAGRPDIPVVISSGEDDGSVTQGISEMHQTLILSNSMRTDILKGGSFTIRIGRPVDGNQHGVVALMKERKVNRVTAVRGDQSWAESSFIQLADIATTSSIQVQAAGKIWNNVGRPSDEVLSKIKESRPELLYMIAAGGEQADAIDAMRAGGIETPLVTVSACTGGTVLEKVKKYRGPLYSIDIAVDRGAAIYAEFSEKFAKRFPKLEMTLDTMIAFDAINLIAEGYKAGVGTSVAMRDFMIKKRKFSGVAGAIEFQSNGDSVRPVMVNTVQGGECRQLVSPESHLDGSAK